jgi:hypothetical protein
LPSNAITVAISVANAVPVHVTFTIAVNITVAITIAAAIAISVAIAIAITLAFASAVAIATAAVNIFAAVIDACQCCCYHCNKRHRHHPHLFSCRVFCPTAVDATTAALNTVIVSVAIIKTQ